MSSRASKSNIKIGTVETRDFRDIYCTAYISCKNKTFINGDNLYCNGGYTCEHSIIDNFNTVWMYARNGGYYTEISNIEEDVYCGAKWSCQNAIISNVGNDVYGTGYFALQYSIISNVTNNVIAFGRNSLDSGYVFNATNVVCNGIYSCHHTQFLAVTYIYAYGDAALANTEIYSAFDMIYGVNNTGIDNNDRTMIIRANGTDGNEWTRIYCNESDICKIDCQTQNACKYFYLFCEGDCYVSCGGGMWHRNSFFLFGVAVSISRTRAL